MKKLSYKGKGFNLSKVIGPLFSIVAMGKIDNKLIYRKRKGLNDVKQYVKTINPNTAGQQTQKGFFANAINSWKVDGYTPGDKLAWDHFAKTKKIVTSGFNRFTGFQINAEKEGNTWNKLTNCIIYDDVGEGFKVDVNVNSDYSGILYLGISKYSMLKEIIGVFSVNKYTFTLSGLNLNTKYYFYIKNTSVGESARTGIYSEKTLDHVPIPIIIGREAKNRSSGVETHTLINKGVVANASGKLTSVEIYCNISLANCKVATFYVVSGNNLSTRDHQLIGAVPAGSKQILSVDLNVVAGDYLGLYYPTGRIDNDLSGGAGMWYTLNSDNIPCTNKTFQSVSGYILSLEGKGWVS